MKNKMLRRILMLVVAVIVMAEGVALGQTRAWALVNELGMEVDATIADLGVVVPATAPSIPAAATTNVQADPAVPNAALITVDLVIFAGQSNMSGAGGNLKDAPSVPNGQGYEFRNGQYPAGLYTVEEPFGVTADGYLSDPAGVRTGSLVSAFMNSYYAKTGIPVMGVSASRGGTSVNYWNTPEVQKDLMYKYQCARAWCASNNVAVRHSYVVWLQGETDAIAGMGVEEYQTKLKQAFSGVIGQGVEQVFIVTIGNYGGLPGAYDTIVAAQTTLCATDPYFTLGTDVLHNLPDTSTIDGVHYNQKALNQAGSLAGATAAVYSSMIR